MPHYLSLMPLVQWRQAVHPIDWSECFGRSAPLVVEIGFGLGDFLVRQARDHPQENFVGLELGWVPVRRALRKIALAGTRNVRVVRLDARVGLERLFSEKSIHTSYSLFPCPWPKKRHAKYRLLSHDFLRLLNSRLVEGGEAWTVTDHGPFSDWVLSQVPGTGFEASRDMVAPRFLTKYERKWHAMGQERFYLLRLTKQEHVTIPVEEGKVLMTHRIPRFDPGRFRPVRSTGEITVDVKEILYDPQRKKAMVRTVVAEDGLLQEFWVEIVKIGESWHVRPAKGCGLIPTAGVQRALDLVRDAAGA
jgi:tRNA (guanine-N7-)-methyltransferase